MAVLPSVNTGGKRTNAKNVAVLPSVNTGGERPDAKSVAVLPSVITGGERPNAKSVADLPFVNTGGRGVAAKSVVGLRVRAAAACADAPVLLSVNESRCHCTTARIYKRPDAKLPSRILQVNIPLHVEPPLSFCGRHYFR